MSKVLVLDCRYCGGGIHIDLTAPDVPVVSRSEFLVEHAACLADERVVLPRVA